MVDLTQLQRFMKNPAMLDESTIPELEQLIREFPYFQISHSLLAINSKAVNHIRYSGRLKMAAAHAGDRGLLRRHIENIASNREIDVAESVEKTIEKDALVAPAVHDKKPEADEAATHESPGFQEEHSLPAEEQIEVVPSNLPVASDSVKQDEGKPDLPEQKPQSLLSHLRELADKSGHVEAETSVEPEVLDEKPTPISEEKHVDEEMTTKVFTEEKSEEGTSVAQSAEFPDELLLESLQYGQYRVEDALKDGKADDLAEQKAPVEEVNEGLPDKNKDLIDRFIEAGPRISKPKKEFFKPADKARESSIDHEGIVSETLAKIYLQQGNPEKAINTYQKLSLNNPEKSSYFAAQIAKIQDDLLNA